MGAQPFEKGTGSSDVCLAPGEALGEEGSRGFGEQFLLKR